LNFKKFELGIGMEISQYQLLDLSNNLSYIDSKIIEPNSIDSNFKSDNHFFRSYNTKLNIHLSYANQITKTKFIWSPRISYSYGEGLKTYQSWYKSTSYPYDTLTSSLTSEKYYFDSNINETKNLFIRSFSHTIKTALLIDYQLSKQFYLYSGFEFGMEFHNKIQIAGFDTKSYAIEQFNANQDSIGLFSNSNNSISTTGTIYSAPKIQAFSIGIPIGIKFKLNKNDNFLKNLLCSYEFNLNQIYYTLNETLSVKKPQQSHLLRLIYEF
jgi:hypothetical protein